MKNIGFYLFLFLSIKGFTQEAKLVFPAGHLNGVINAEFSPDGKFIATGGFDNALKVWESSTGRLISTLNHNSNVRIIKFSPNGKYIITDGVPEGAVIWELSTGEPKIELKGHTREVSAIEFSPDGKTIITSSGDGTAKLWDFESGKMLKNFVSRSPYLRTVSFSPDGKYIVTGGDNAITEVWEVSSGTLLKDLSRQDKIAIFAARFSENGKYVASIGLRNELTVWELSTGKVIEDIVLKENSFSRLQTLGIHLKGINDRSLPEFSSDGLYVVVPAGITTNIFETASGKLLHTLEGHPDGVTSAHFSPDSKYVITTSRRDMMNPGNQETAIVWETKSGRKIHQLTGRTIVSSGELSPDGKHIIIVFANDKVKTYETATGKLVSIVQGTQADLSPDGEYMVTFQMGEKKSPKVWRVATGDLIRELPKHNYPTSAQFILGGKYILTTDVNVVRFWETVSGKDMGGVVAGNEVIVATKSSKSENVKHFATVHMDSNTAKIWDVSGKQVKEIPQFLFDQGDIQFSSDGKYIFIHPHVMSPWTLVEIATWRTVASSKFIEPFYNTSANFSPDGKYIIIGKGDIGSTIFETSTGRSIKELPRAMGGKFSPNGKRIFTYNDVGDNDNTNVYLSDPFTERPDVTLLDAGRSVYMTPDEKKIFTISRDNTTKVFDGQTGKEMLSFIPLDSTDWIANTPTGLFDASPNAMSMLYFVQGFEVIEFSQLKDRYYEPYLWKKIFSGETPRSVEHLASIIELPPDIKVSPVDEKGYLTIELTNKNGGIGEVALYIQGKEVVKDARDKNANPDAPTMKIKYFISNHKNLINGTNYIAVKAWNKNHWVESRGTIISYTKGETENNYKPSVHILVCGVSDYAGGTDIDLTYAAKDADDVSKALKLGATKLFGVQKSYVYNLTTTMSKEYWPTKTNIINTFKKITETAHPLDIIVVYLSGHGINLGGENGDWYYLTQEANTATAVTYNDPSIRQGSTISSTELVELFNTVPAAKQVLMIDACASGRVVDNLVVKRDIPSSTLRTLDRMKDRTGMHIITGCTADAVSYEASRYGQGVLTYSLLEGIRGAALRDDEFVDVNRLFQYAQERVPVLAEDIGGIQTPMIFSPKGSQSFDIGQLTIAEKKQIPISNVRSVYIQSNFQDEDELGDVIGLGKKVDQLLAESSARGTDAPIVFVPVREYPDGCQFVGRYKRMNGKIILKLKKKCMGQDSMMEMTGTDLHDLSNKVVQLVK